MPSSPALQPISESAVQSHEAEEKYADAMNWDELEFGVIPTDYMYIMKCSNGDNFSQGHLAPYGKIELSPFSIILNYGQGVLEGLKAIRTKDGRVQLFRPEENALRMKMGAARLCMPSPSTHQFLDALKQTVLANKRWVPPEGKGALYIRALLIGSGPGLGLGSAPEYTFLIFATPVGNYHKPGSAMNLYLEKEVRRATPGGTGGIKSITNYSPVFEVLTKARAKGFTDVLFLDAATGKNIEEVSTCNIFFVKDNVILTPCTNGTVLPGITRKSIIEIALDLNYLVEERDVPLEDALAADEVFCTGTAVEVTAVASITYQDKSHDAGEEYVDVNWDELKFGVIPTDYMYTMKRSKAKGDDFSQGHLTPYGNIELNPSAGVLNYGQGLYEGLKVNRTEDGRFLLFRLELNALRMKMSAERLCMLSPSTQQFLDAIKQTVLANKRWVPPPGKGTLYLRPLLMGSGSVLGIGPAPEYTFPIFASPVGNDHKGRAALNLYVEDKLHRATPGGTGGVKSITNHSAVYLAQKQAKAKGFSDVLFLDSVTGKNIEENTACNIFIVKGIVISTPAIHGTVLPGITRKSIIDIALNFGYQVEERVIPVEDLLEADESFCTRTAVVVNPIGAVTYQGKRVEYKTGKGALSQKLYETLTGIQTGRLEDKKGWTMEIY